jgi:hypothetical protein
VTDEARDDGPSDAPETQGATAEHEQEREAALDAMPEGNATTADQVTQREPDTEDHED